MQNFINYKNSKIAYSDVGKGSAIVLLHGFLENSTMWKDIVFELSKRNRVICIDLLGHGNTECIGYVHSMDDMAEAVKEVLNSLRIRRSIFIGHSMGGYVALAFAEKYLKNVKGLCLLNSTAQADNEERKELRKRACDMAQKNHEPLIKMSITNLFSENKRLELIEEIEQVKNEALKVSVRGYIAANEGMRLRGNKEVVLKSIEKRLIVLGKKDPVLNYESIIDEAKRTNTPLVELPNGHMSYLEDKDETIKILRAFVK
ncbi:alpha/beta hydrolase [Tenacibaculum sp. S7007]|uniref:Alpha/beta hydrolase n=1 Tax=Tenacibaculum pelagium TaxID=2759527 RepID=A0A839AR40_9FLAO|nr:alpha/beta hydrolase [Tenacibaculum pelagium]MBA6156840.1 alpha/beta hydrolase [Tenacibaculum pelagium]